MLHRYVEYLVKFCSNLYHIFITNQPFFFFISLHQTFLPFKSVIHLNDIDQFKLDKKKHVFFNDPTRLKSIKIHPISVPGVPYVKLEVCDIDSFRLFQLHCLLLMSANSIHAN